MHPATPTTGGIITAFLTEESALGDIVDDSVDDIVDDIVDDSVGQMRLVAFCCWNSSIIFTVAVSCSTYTSCDAWFLIVFPLIDDNITCSRCWPIKTHM
jgi:hypothetical protein